MSERRVVLLFPGQGTLRAGMGRELLVALPGLREELRRVSSIIGLDLESTSRGPLSAMVPTDVAQRLVVGWALALHAHVLGDDLPLVGTAGHSVGELAAVAAAGVIDIDDALRLVVTRAEVMAGLRAGGAMTAIEGIERERIEANLARVPGGGAVVGLHNGSTSVVVSGTEEAVALIEAGAKAWGARRVVRLAVSDAFHSPAMTPAARPWRDAVDATAARPGRCPVVLNVDGTASVSVGRVLDGLVTQLDHPVEWLRCLDSIAALRPTDLVEVGATSSLLRAARRHLATTSRSVRCWSLADPRQARRWAAWRRTPADPDPGPSVARAAGSVVTA
ncbi:MAG TPA: ACP S-malonyltransferase [Microthrixaceae bacterium]|nr:ACP S-malonyltransferase [Microthrixaceae bacterium]